MIDLLLGVPGKLKAIYDYLTTNWTTTRAAKIDYLTANVAVASTAVSNANYTSARASLIDFLQAPPISVNGGTRQDYFMWAGGGNLIELPGSTQASANTSTLVDVVNITGSGFLEHAIARAGGPDVTNGVRLVITIDGTVCFDVTGNAPSGSFWSLSCALGYYTVQRYYTGSAVQFLVNAHMDSSRWPFRTSLRVQVSNAGVGTTAYAHAKYIKLS